MAVYAFVYSVYVCLHVCMCVSRVFAFVYILKSMEILNGHIGAKSCSANFYHKRVYKRTVVPVKSIR